MNRHSQPFIALAIALILLIDASAAAPPPVAAFTQAGALIAGPGAPEGTLLGTGFTYQGQLSSGSSPYTGTCGFQFGLWDAPGFGSTQVGTTQTVGGVSVTDGLFTVSLDFGQGAFLGEARWLELAVRCPDSGAYAVLAPRQRLTPAPQALYAGIAGTLARPGFKLGTLDSAGTVGWATSLAIGADGLGLIAYYDLGSFDLKVAHCDNLACTSATLSTLDSLHAVGLYASLAIGADGLGLISYLDFSANDLKVAHCNDLACTSATLTTLDSTGWSGPTPRSPSAWTAWA